MPNHVRNIINFDCSEERLREILEAIQYDKSDFHENTGIGTLDFNKIIPMPKSLEIEAGSSTDRGLKAYKDFLYVYTLAGTRQGLDLLNIPAESEEAFLRQRTDIKREDWNLGKTAFQNSQKYGATTWYEWSIGHWGTKWNSYDSAGYQGGHQIEFSTAWSAPHPILEKLTEMFPDVTINHKWADEDLGNNCGALEYLDGEVISDRMDMGDKEALEFACETWGYDLADMGYVLSADGERYIYTESHEYDLIEVCGQPALFTNERLTDGDIPKGLFRYDLRDSDDGDGFATLEANVAVNHGGTVITAEPIDLGEQGYIAFTDDTSPNFLGTETTFKGFMDGDFEQTGGMNL